MQKFRRLIALLAIAFPSTMLAQVMMVRVVDQRDAPVPGAVLQLIDSAGTVVARSLTDDQGELSLTAPKSGRYRVRTLRIGFRPVISGPITLASEAPPAVQRIALEGLPIRLDTIHVAGDRVCRTDSGGVAFRLWEQARIAILAAELSATDHGVYATTLGYVRTLDPDRRHVLSHKLTILQGYVTQPWRTIPEDSLHRIGFVKHEADGSATYYAPGLDMLASATFMEDHCFHFVGLTNGEMGTGVAFEPTPERRGVADIRGRVWLDPATAELRSIQYEYQDESSAAEPGSAEMQFEHLRNGMWVISHWRIVVPVTERVVRSQTFGGPETRVVQVSETGGDLVLVRRALDTLWSRPPLVLSGIVSDSLSGRPVAGAHVTLLGTTLSAVSNGDGRFAISGVLPGDYTFEVRTSSLDSVAFIHRARGTFADTGAAIRLRLPSAALVMRQLCGVELLPGRGVILGHIVHERELDSSATSDTSQTPVTVSAVWGGASDAQRAGQWRDTRTTSTGAFRICDVPVGVAVTLQALSPRLRSRTPVRVTIPSNVPFTRAELQLERVPAAAAGATFTGTVVADSSRRAVAGARVELPDLGLSAITNEEGAFRFDGVPAGTQRVTVHHIGHEALAASILLPAGEVVNRRLVLDRVTSLDPVIVSATEVDRAMASFEEHRSIGLGHFLTSDQLRKLEGLSTGAVLSGLTGIAFARGRGGQQWVIGSRPHSLFGTATATLDDGDRRRGAPSGACYAHVYLDRTLVYAGKYEEPLFDVNSISPSQIEAVEYYSGPAQTPPEYSGLNSVCGILVIWTREFR